MKKIKSIKHLQAEKERINQQQQELLKKIKGNWADLKDDLKPVNVAKNIFTSALKSKSEDNPGKENVFSSTVNHGISLLAKKVADKLEEKFSSFYKK